MKGETQLFTRIEMDSSLSASEARALVMGGSLPKDTVHFVSQAYKKLCEQEKDSNLMVAVRSSATAEDSADASFAGQLDTILGVQGETQVLEAIKQCWASLYSDRVDAYRKMAGKPRGSKECSISVCVVIQVMLNADAAGVMFTANPMTQDLNQVVVTGNWGIGESVVADLATPDQWILDGSGGLVR
jgi:pyruvate,water dikinase